MKTRKDLRTQVASSYSTLRLLVGQMSAMLWLSFVGKGERGIPSADRFLKSRRPPSKYCPDARTFVCFILE